MPAQVDAWRWYRALVLTLATTLGQPSRRCGWPLAESACGS
jgi:hypothetical protein